jgi:non-ribosomal peptide synthetase component F
MVGLLINALPIATQVPAGENCVEWLAELQEQQISARQHEYVSIVEAQGWSDVPRGIPLFNTLLVFENYPRVSAQWSPSNDSLVMTEKHALEWNSYPLSVLMSIGSQFFLRLEYDHQYYDDAAAEQLGQHFLTLLKGIIEGGQARGVFRQGDVEQLALTAWSGIHGLSLLLIGGNLPDILTLDIDNRSLTASVTGLFLEGLKAR